MALNKVKKAANVIPLLLNLKKERQWRANEIVDFSLSSAIIKPAQVSNELHQFAQRVADLKPRIVLEIGTANGGTLCVLSRLAAPDATIISVDLPGGEFGGGYQWFHVPIFKSFTQGQQKLHLFRGNSHSPEMLKQVQDILGKQTIDLLFIDGDHTYEGVKQDFTLYSGMVRDGGMIAFHDIAVHTDPSCQVSVFWDEVKKKFKHEEIIEDRKQGWAGIGLLYL